MVEKTREQASLRIIISLASMVGLAIVIILAFVSVSAIRQNKFAIESSKRLAETAITIKEREIGRNLKDYAVWEDAFNNLHNTLNLEWASKDGNIGANIYNSLGYDMAFVFDADRKTVYSVLGGKPSQSDAQELLPNGLPELLERAAREPEPAIGLLKAKDGLVLVAATAILPPSIDPATLPAPERSVMLFAKRLDEAFLHRIEQEYLLKQIGIVPIGETGASPVTALKDPLGNTLAEITWTPEQPGTELLWTLLPLLTVALLTLITFAWLSLRNAHRATSKLAASARTIEAYADTLAESEARFRDVAEASSDWIWECDAQLRLVYLSARFTEVTGLAAATVLDRSLSEFFSSDTETNGWNQLRNDAREAFRDLRCRYRDVSGHSRICRLAGRPVTSADGVTFSGYRGTATDVTTEVEAQARANHLALHDALTELPNRVLLRERLNMALLASKGQTTQTAVLCLDLDDFKEVNDTLGHGAGDQLLRQLGERLRAAVLVTDTVGRLGGDEFAVVQAGVALPSEADALARRLIAAVKKPFVVDGHELYVGVSVGVALSSEGDDTERMLKNADIALYRAKQAGRGTVRFFEPEMDLELQARKSLEHDLRQAISKEELDLHYQPLVDLGDREIAAVEALLRWNHPTRGSVPPDAFISIAEETGLIIAIGDWVLRTACRQALEWPGIRVAVNLSPIQFKSRELVDNVRNVLMETGLSPERLELEITESVLLHDTRSALEILNGLKQLGVRIAMDDFGTGYSSLRYLNSFPFDKIKIDKSFIADMADRDKSSAIVKSVISLGQSLNMTTTAEGVETPEQAAFLASEGCEQVQGFYFGRPMPAKDFTALLRDWTGGPETAKAAAA